jgi:Integrase zinc binding domain
MTYQQRRKFLSEVRYYFWDDPLLFKLGVNGIHRRCILENEMSSVLFHCHSSPYGEHSTTDKITTKILQAGFFWPTLFKDVRNFVKACDKCQQMGSIFRRNEMPQKGILEIELFDIWGVDFMGPSKLFTPENLGN